MPKMPQIASPDPLFVKKFSGGGMPPDPPRGSCPPGTRNTPTAYFKNLADYFQIFGNTACTLYVVAKTESLDRAISETS